MCVCVCEWMDGCVCEWVCGCMCLCVYVLLAGHPLPLRLTLRRSLLNIDSLTLHSILRLLLLAAQMQFHTHTATTATANHITFTDYTSTATLIIGMLTLLKPYCSCCWYYCKPTAATAADSESQPIILCTNVDNQGSFYVDCTHDGCCLYV